MILLRPVVRILAVAMAHTFSQHRPDRPRVNYRGHRWCPVGRDTNRDAACAHGIVPVIPYRSNSKVPHRPMPRNLCKIRVRIEQLIGKLKRFKRVAMRCEKTKNNYASIVAVAFAIILIKSVHRA
jgi:hypothetical protein